MSQESSGGSKEYEVKDLARDGGFGTSRKFRAEVTIKVLYTSGHRSIFYGYYLLIESTQEGTG